MRTCCSLVSSDMVCLRGPSGPGCCVFESSRRSNIPGFVDPAGHRRIGALRFATLPNLYNTKVPLLLSTEGTEKHGREKGALFRVFRVFRGPSLFYSCLPSWFPIQERGNQQYQPKPAPRFRAFCSLRTTNAHESTRILIGVDSCVFVLIRGSNQGRYSGLEFALLVETSTDALNYR